MNIHEKKRADQFGAKLYVENMPSLLLDAWLRMLDHASDHKAFRDDQTAFNRLYRRASNADQGAFHQALAENHKAALS